MPRRSAEHERAPRRARGKGETGRAHRAKRGSTEQSGQLHGNIRCAADRAIEDDCTAGKYWKLDQADQGYRIRTESFGNGVTTTYSYDNLMGRVQSIATHDSADRVLQDIQYTQYDENGNLRVRSETLRLPGASSTTTIGDGYEYDELDRLTSNFTTRPIPNGTNLVTHQNFAYDALGNMTSKTDVGGYSYDPEPGERRLPHGVQRITDGSNASVLKYDGAGNVTERSGTGVRGDSQTLEYTAFNLPKRVTFGDGQAELRYEYDASQRRVLTSIGNGNEQRVYVGSGYERQRSASGELTHLYKVFAAGRQVAQVERSSGGAELRRYIHGDHLASSHLITDEDGEVVHVQRFDAFGAAEDAASTSSDAATRNIRAGFTGHETDVETGLVNMGGRIYDARIGRFLQADPIIHADSQGLNRFSYVRNNPMNSVDPSGFCDDCDDDEADDPNIVWANEAGESSPVGYGAGGGGPVYFEGHVAIHGGGMEFPHAPSDVKAHWGELVAQVKDAGVTPAPPAPPPTPAPAAGSAPPPPPPPVTPPKVEAKTESHTKPSASQPSIPHESAHGSEASGGEGAQAVPAGLQAVLQNLPSQKSQFGQQLLVSNLSTGITAGGEGVALAAAAAPVVVPAAVTGVEAVALSAPELVPAVTQLLTAGAGARAAGGAVAGGLSQAVQGNGLEQILLGAGVNAVVSAANPLGFIGSTPVTALGGATLTQLAPTAVSALTGGLNSLTANLLTQAGNAALNGTSFNPYAAGASFTGGALFGGIAGATPVTLGANLVYGLAKGANQGLLGGATAVSLP